MHVSGAYLHAQHVYVAYRFILYIIYIYATPPPPGTQAWAWFRCALTAEAGRKNSSDLHTGRPEEGGLPR